MRGGKAKTIRAGAIGEMRLAECEYIHPDPIVARRARLGPRALTQLMPRHLLLHPRAGDRGMLRVAHDRFDMKAGEAPPSIEGVCKISAKDLAADKAIWRKQGYKGG